MSAIANIVAFDGAAPPVSHTLVPISVTRERGKVVAVYREKLMTLPDEAQVFVIYTQEQTKAGTTITTVDVNVPVMESVSGVNSSGYTAAPKVAFIDRNVYTNYAPKRSTVTSRRLARQLLVNILGNVVTSVAPATTGMTPEAVDLLVSPT